MDGRMEGGRVSVCVCGGVPCFFVSPPVCLFGEFADDTDQCSVFILKTLVVRSQVNQDLVEKIELPLKTNRNHQGLEPQVYKSHVKKPNKMSIIK